MVYPESGLAALDEAVRQFGGTAHVRGACIGVEQEVHSMISLRVSLFRSW